MTAHHRQKADLSSLAREALAQTDGKTGPAILVLEERLDNDKVLRRSIIEQAVKEAGRYAVAVSHHAERFTIVQGLKNGRANVRSFATGMTRTILDYPLLDGTKLRDATHDDLDRAIQDYATKAQASAHRARWLKTIRDLVPAQGKVGDTVDDETAHRLWTEAE